MAEQSKTTLKTYFNTSDIPTEAQFIDLIDSIGLQSNSVTLSSNLGNLTTTVESNSANWDLGYTNSLTLSTYTPLNIYQSTSGVYTTVESNSANWETAYITTTSLDQLIFTNITTTDSMITTVTASNLFANFTLNGSAFCLPLYKYN